MLGAAVEIIWNNINGLQSTAITYSGFQFQIRFISADRCRYTCFIIFVFVKI
jgi:hypothetical protein